MVMMVDLSGDAPAPTVSVKVLVHVGLGVQDGCESVAVTPGGTPLTDKLTACGDPASNVALIGTEADAPIAITASLADSEYLNGSTTVTKTDVLTTPSLIGRALIGGGPSMVGKRKFAVTSIENWPSGVDAEVAIIRLT